MHARTQLRRRIEGDRGSVTIYLIGMILAALLVAGLAVDGSRAAQGAARAQSIAAEAARAGGQAIDPAAALQGQDVVDPAAAVAAAQSYLSAAGVAGQVQVSGNQLIVDVTVSTSTSFLALIGIESFTLEGHGVADLVRS